MRHKVWAENKNEKAMELLLNVFVLILCKKIPPEIGVNKIDTLHNKVKLLSPTVYMKEQPKPEAAVLRLIH